MKTRFLRFAALSLLIPTITYSQYYGERPLEKSFEHANFFFLPNHVAPFGLGSFSKTIIGLINDPLLDLAFNPARWPADTLSNHYLYADFRSPASSRRHDMDYVQPMHGGMEIGERLIYPPYPIYPLRKQQELEPVVSAAYLSHSPIPSVPQLSFGITYQAIFQDDRYYSMPELLYMPVRGGSYTGGVIPGSELLPTFDRAAGVNNMQNVGHFATFLSGWDFGSGTRLGARIGRAIFDREGSYGNQNTFVSTPQSSWGSRYSSSEERRQPYRHWDIALGAEHQIAEKISGGVHLGYLWGTARQALDRTNYELSSSGQINSGTSWSYHLNDGTTQQNWNRTGRYLSGGLYVDLVVGEQQTLRLAYTGGRERTTNDLSSTVRDTSYSDYSWQSGSTPYRSIYASRLNDLRTGGGTRTGNTHRFLTALLWKVKEEFNLSLGLQIDVANRITRTEEIVSANSRSGPLPGSTTTGWPFYSLREDKTLIWDFEAKNTSIQIPLFVTLRTSDLVSIQLGVNRKMSSSKVNEWTTSHVRIREEVRDSVFSRKENFVERYLTPSERFTDVETSFLAGLAFTPVGLFRARLLVMPRIEDTYNGRDLELRWWIAVDMNL